ncbi:16S rRNA (cytidine(1402)-2'-O)-methyltransferase [Thermoclostridium stercorarium]|nr:16S rRNA (cytidine(1402)-2'-O)-methyltransferase [Thermoclostridium stercorarium]
MLRPLLNERVVRMEEVKTGTLYLVATPIGNLEDITYRALKTLKEVDLIAAEDTRHSLKLLNHFEIKKPLISYFEHNKTKRGEEIIKHLLEGKNIALITDAGTPGISDPGEDLVRLAIENNINVTVIPGCTASVTALVLSGLPIRRFAFEGFLPHDKNERKKYLELLIDEGRTMVFYISPHNCLDVLKEMKEILGDRKGTLCRELTKKYEEVIRGTLSEIIESLKSGNRMKGEMVLVIEGAPKKDDCEKEDWLSVSLDEHMNFYLSQGYDKKEAMKLVAKDRGITKREVYAQYMRKT